MKRVWLYLSASLVIMSAVILIQTLKPQFAGGAVYHVYHPDLSLPRLRLFGISGWWMVTGMAVGIVTIAIRVFKPGGWKVEWEKLVGLCLPLCLALPWWSFIQNYPLKAPIALILGWGLVSSITKTAKTNV